MLLPLSWEIPSEIKQRLGQKKSGKQRAMVANGHLLLVLHKVPQSQQREREAVFFWCNPDNRWMSSEYGKSLIYLMEEYSEAEQNLLRLYDSAQTANDYFQILQEITPLLRATKNLHATLQSAREAMPHLRDLIDWRDWADELERSLDMLYMDTKNGLDFRLAQQAETQAKLSLQSVKAGDRLNLLAAIFLPLTAISSVFVLDNTKFWFVLITGISLGFLLKTWVFQDVPSESKRIKVIK